ncbi:hypothetical protein AB0A05_27205 [Streptomyces sp. NPDC046374]|uniref:hypothetical protein n=1 Tax=Streptomyces sp. NPDC046374 TaxID=3154917 RepID=UPI0033F82EE1
MAGEDTVDVSQMGEEEVERLLDRLHREAVVFPARFPSDGERPMARVAMVDVVSMIDVDEDGRLRLVLAVDASEGIELLRPAPGADVPIVLEINGERVWER